MYLVRNSRTVIIPLAIIGMLSLAFLWMSMTVRGQVSEIPAHLQLKADKSDIIGSKVFSNGEVTYAYKSNVLVPLSPSPNVRRSAQKLGLVVLEEIDYLRTKHARTFKTDSPNQFVTEVIGGEPQYYRDSNGDWWQADYATTTSEAFALQTKPSLLGRIFQFAHADSSTFYPDPDPETSTVDGYVHGGGHSTWDAAHDSTGGGEAFPSDINMAINSGEGGGGYSIRRVAILFDTSSIPDTHTVNSATVSLYVETKTNTDNDGDDFISIVTSNLASNTDITTSDFDDIGDSIDNPTEQHNTSQRKDITDITTGQYEDWTLNATGIGNINITGITKFGVREGHDIIDSPITEETSDYISVSASDASGTSQDPKLVVVHEHLFVTQFKVRKGSNESRVSTTTLDEDSELFLGLSPNKTYGIEGVVFATSSTVQPDLKIGWGFPADMVVDLGFIAANGSSFRAAELLNNSTTSSQTIQLSAGEPAVIHIKGTVVVGSSSSTLFFLWAQGSSNSTPTTVLKGSYLRAEEI